MKTVIGLVGPIASGKGIVAKLLEEKGYSRYVLSDIIKREIANRGQPNLINDRATLQNVGDDLRKKHGLQVLVELTALFIDEDKSQKIVIDGIRNPGEINFLRKKYKAIIIAVDANREVRKKRYLSRSKPGDPKAEVDFNKIESRDRGIGQEKYGQQVQKCIKMADKIILNNSNSEKELLTVVDKILTSI